MLVNTKDLISLAEANKNFSKVARKVDEKGSVLIMENNNPRYLGACPITGLRLAV